MLGNKADPNCFGGICCNLHVLVKIPIEIQQDVILVVVSENSITWIDGHPVVRIK